MTERVVCPECGVDTNGCLVLDVGSFCRKPAAPARQPVTFTIPPGTPASRCRSCSQTIFWIPVPSGKKMPLDHDGRSHFATCPQAKLWRKSR